MFFRSSMDTKNCKDASGLAFVVAAGNSGHRHFGGAVHCRHSYNGLAATHADGRAVAVAQDPDMGAPVGRGWRVCDGTRTRNRLDHNQVLYH